MGKQSIQDSRLDTIKKENTRLKNELKMLQTSFGEASFVDPLCGNLIHDAMFPIVVVSVESGNVLYSNNYARSFFGVTDSCGGIYTAEKFWVDPDRRLDFVKLVLAEGEVKEFKAVLRAADNKHRHVLLSSRLIEYSSQKAIYSIYSDITDRIMTQTAYEQSERRFRLLANNMKDVLWIADEDLTPIYVTPSIEAFSGYTAEEFIRKPFITHMTPKYQRRFGRMIKKMLQILSNNEELSSNSFEFECIRKNGSIVWVEIATSAMWDSSGKLSGFAGVLRDSTKRVKEQIDLKNAKRIALAASQMKSEFLANMSHEIRTPMNGVLGLLQLLQETELSELQEKYVSTALGAGKSLLKIINDILDFSKIEAGKVECTTGPVSLRPLIHSVVTSLKTMVAKDAVLLSYKVDPIIPDTISACGSRLKQVLFNLIGNAVKFTENGVITLDVSVAPGSDTQQMLLQFTIEDTGIGMSSKMQEHLFEPFTQEDGSFRRKYGGTGLGLSIVRHLVEMMGGKIQFESTKGEGTKVTFTIRAVRLDHDDQETKKAQKDNAASESNVASEGKILVVEDEQINAMVITAMLKSLGFEVVHAPDGMRALALLRDTLFDCIFMDIQMPEMDGIETTREIRHSIVNANASIPIIALTAHAMKGDREQFIAAGMNDYLAKPVEVERLTEVLERIRIGH